MGDPADETPRILYVARHGETDWNAAGRLQGHTDVPLNDRGRAQARALAERLRGERVAWVASSDLSRARETAEIVAHALGVGFAFADHDLRERAFGAFEGLTREELTARHGDAWRAYQADPRNVPDGAETEDVLAARVVTAMLRAAKRLDPRDGAALVVIHGAALRVLVSTITKTRIAPIANAAMYRVRSHGRELTHAELVDA
jgi:probable phosphoglycerate mutase